MSRKTRGRIRMLFALPSAAVLAFGATQAFASPAGPARAPNCATYCDSHVSFCTANPTAFDCRYCGCIYP
jgi:hypothetical protein